MNAYDLVLALNQYAALDPSPVCWTRWNSGGLAASGIYCWTCAMAEVVIGHGEIVVYEISYESDGCAHCSICNLILDYHLTDCGVDEELDYFHGLRLTTPLPKQDAYHIARIIEAAPENKDALRLAKRALAKATEPHLNPEAKEGTHHGID